MSVGLRVCVSGMSEPACRREVERVEERRRAESPEGLLALRPRGNPAGGCPGRGGCPGPRLQAEPGVSAQRARRQLEPLRLGPELAVPPFSRGCSSR